MTRIQYRPVPDRVQPYFSVSILRPHQPPFLAGYVYRYGATWTARGRATDIGKAVTGWPRRSDAAAWLLIEGGFCQARQAAVAA